MTRRAEVRKLEKIRLLERGESLQGHRPKPNQSNGQVPVEVLDRIEEVARGNRQMPRITVSRSAPFTTS